MLKEISGMLLYIGIGYLLGKLYSANVIPIEALVFIAFVIGFYILTNEST